MSIWRRAALVGVFSVSLGLSAFAIVQAAPDPAKPEAPKAAPQKKPVEIGKVFPFLDKYLSLPPADRSRFVLAYYIRENGRALQGVKVWIQHGGEREEIPVGVNGRVERLPTLAEIKSKDRIGLDVPADARINVGFSPELSARPAAEMSAADVAAGIDQVNAAIHRFAGLLGFVVPHISRAVFAGAGSGTALTPDGKSTPLPTASVGPYYDPATLKGVRTLRFAKTPTRIVLATGK